MVTVENSNAYPLGRTNIGLAQTTEQPGQKLLVVNGVVVGPFEDEDEGTDITRDVVKVKGEDPGTPDQSRKELTPGP